MIKDIRIKQVNKQLHNYFAKLRLFPGTALKHPRYCVVLSLIPKTLGRIILHGEVLMSITAPEKIASLIGTWQYYYGNTMAIPCRDYNVNSIFITASPNT